MASRSPGRIRRSAWCSRTRTSCPGARCIRNIHLPFEIKRLRPQDHSERITQLLERVGLLGFEHKYPRELSGGMQQRASIVRSLSVDPSLLLMDEPFGALDAFTRDEMNLLLQEIWLETGKTIVFITHNIAEAVFLADRIMVMTPRPGRLANIFTIDLPRPRPLEVTAQAHFFELVAEIKGSIDHGGARAGRVGRAGLKVTMDSQLRDQIPTFEKSAAVDRSVELTNLSALTSALGGIRTWAEIGAIVLFAVFVVGGTELLLRVLEVPQYIMPPPSMIIAALISDFPLLAPHIGVTLTELLVGFAIGASIGFVLAAVITQFPFVEKIVAPYILMLVTTPMLALVPLLILRFGFGLEPRIIAVALASGPMVMINAATGFRRVDLAKIALARSFGASTLQIFLKIRIPMAMPMVIVGLMIGSIFGLLTAVGAEMVGGSSGLGNRLAYYSSLIQMPQFFACILILATIGISIYVLFFWIGKKWASWEA